jgi:hypothetical protein
MCECEGVGALCDECRYNVLVLFHQYWIAVIYNVHE